MSETHEVKFVASGRGKARCAPDPNYPDGIALPPPPGAENVCAVSLPYPAPECGYYLIRCRLCESTMIVTAAGRADDPLSCYMSCNLGEAKEAVNE